MLLGVARQAQSTMQRVAAAGGLETASQPEAGDAKEGAEKSLSDGSDEDAILSLITASARPPPRSQQAAPRRADAPKFAVGDSVEARWRGQKRWFPGRISEVLAHGTKCNVMYDDGDDECGVPAHRIRALAASDSEPEGERLGSSRAADSSAAGAGESSESSEQSGSEGSSETEDDSESEDDSGDDSEDRSGDDSSSEGRLSQSLSYSSYSYSSEDDSGSESGGEGASGRAAFLARHSIARAVAAMPVGSGWAAARIAVRVRLGGEYVLPQCGREAAYYGSRQVRCVLSAAAMCRGLRGP